MYEYRKIEGIESALLGLSRRIKHDFQLDKAVKILVEHYDEYEAEVTAFMPIISAKIQNGWKKLILQNLKFHSSVLSSATLSTIVRYRFNRSITFPP